MKKNQTFAIVISQQVIFVVVDFLQCPLKHNFPPHVYPNSFASLENELDTQ